MTFSLSKKSQNSLEIWLALFCFLIRFWFLSQFASSPFFEPISGGNDRSLYDRLAQSFAKGQGFSSGVFEFLPLYPWILGMIYQLFGSNLYLVGLWGAGLDSITTFLIFRLSRKMGASLIPATIAGGAYALYPIAIAYSAVTMPNTLNAFLLTTFAALVCRLHPSKSSFLSFLLLGIFAGFTALGFAGMLLIFGITLLIFLLGFKSSRRTLTCLALAGIGFILPILPVTLHNWKAEQEFVFITAHGGFNFYMGNHEHATGYPVQIEGFRGAAGSLLADARTKAEQDAGYNLSSKEVSQYWSKKAWSWIAQHPWDAIRLFGVKFAKFWNQTDYDDLRLVPMLRLSGVFFTNSFWMGFGWIALLAWVGLWSLGFKEESVNEEVSSLTRLKCMLIAGLVGVVLFFITARYRLTVTPLLLTLGAVGLQRTWIVLSSQTARLHQYGWLWISGVVIVTFPWNKSDFRALDHFNTASFLLQKGLASQAETVIRKGLEYDPSQPDLYFILGNALTAMERKDQALTAYQKTLELNPQHVSAHFNLALTFEQRGDHESAIHELKNTLQWDPKHSKAGALLKQLEDRKNSVSPKAVVHPIQAHEKKKRIKPNR